MAHDGQEVRLRLVRRLGEVAGFVRASARVLGLPTRLALRLVEMRAIQRLRALFGQRAHERALLLVERRFPVEAEAHHADHAAVDAQRERGPGAAVREGRRRFARRKPRRPLRRRLDEVRLATAERHGERHVRVHRDPMVPLQDVWRIADGAEKLEVRPIRAQQEHRARARVHRRDPLLHHDRRNFLGRHRAGERCRHRLKPDRATRRRARVPLALLQPFGQRARLRHLPLELLPCLTNATRHLVEGRAELPELIVGAHADRRRLGARRDHGRGIAKGGERSREVAPQQPRRRRPDHRQHEEEERHPPQEGDGPLHHRAQGHVGENRPGRATNRDGRRDVAAAALAIAEQRVESPDTVRHVQRSTGHGRPHAVVGVGDAQRHVAPEQVADLLLGARRIHQHATLEQRADGASAAADGRTRPVEHGVSADEERRAERGIGRHDARGERGGVQLIHTVEHARPGAAAAGRVAHLEDRRRIRRGDQVLDRIGGDGAVVPAVEQRGDAPVARHPAHERHPLRGVVLGRFGELPRDAPQSFFGRGARGVADLEERRAGRRSDDQHEERRYPERKLALERESSRTRFQGCARHRASTYRRHRAVATARLGSDDYFTPRAPVAAASR